MKGINFEAQINMRHPALNPHNLVRKCELDDVMSDGSGLPIGFIFPWISGNPPMGGLPLLGDFYNREEYADLWNFAKDSNNIIEDSEYETLLTTQSSVGQFSYGDGITTFRLPRIVDFIRGSDNDVGIWQGDAIRNIIGTIGNGRSDIAGTFYASYTTGAFQNTDLVNLDSVFNNSEIIHNTNDRSNRVTFDSSRVVPTADENRPKNIAYPWYIKAFHRTTNSTILSIKEINDKLQSTWLYPNDGTAEAPGIISVSSRYIMDSPWPGYFVKCFPQVLFNGEWGNAEWHDFYNGGPHQGNGVRCNLLGNDKIVVVSGSYFILQDLGPHFQGYPFIVPDSQSVRSAPCRIYCEKGGPLPS